jgi:hypothetical protein
MIVPLFVYVAGNLPPAAYYGHAQEHARSISAISFKRFQKNSTRSCGHKSHNSRMRRLMLDYANEDSILFKEGRPGPESRAWWAGSEGQTGGVGPQARQKARCRPVN